MEKKISDAQLRALNKIRGDWGEVKPYTRIEKDKKKYNRKEKHKGQRYEDQRASLDPFPGRSPAHKYTEK